MTAIAPDERSTFARDGFLIARRVAPHDVVARMKEVAARHLANATAPVEYEADLGYPGAPASIDVAGGRTVRRLLQAYARDPLFRQWSTSRAVGERLKPLLGPDVALSQAHHNCVMTKAPRFSSRTGWHRDIRYWNFERPELVSVWLALGSERRENGCLMVLPGSHLMDFSPARLDAAQFLRADARENQELLGTQLAVELDAGDVLFFDCRLFHAAGNNTTGETKYSVVFTYHDTANGPVPGTRSAALPEVAL